MELKERRIIAHNNLFLIYKLKIKFSKHTHMTSSHYFSQIIYRTYRGTFFTHFYLKMYKTICNFFPEILFKYEV